MKKKIKIHLTNKVFYISLVSLALLVTISTIAFMVNLVYHLKDLADSASNGGITTNADYTKARSILYGGYAADICVALIILVFMFIGKSRVQFGLVFGYMFSILISIVMVVPFVIAPSNLWKNIAFVFPTFGIWVAMFIHLNDLTQLRRNKRKYEERMKYL